MERVHHHHAQTLDVGGAHRYMFFTSSTGVNRTKKGRQVMARRTVASQHCKGHQISNYSRTKESNPSPANMMTMQSSSTQTDMRDSEIQTDPWWYRSEGVPLLCCRGSHRKLEKAKWNARAGDSVFGHSPDQDAFSVHSARLSTSTYEDCSTSDTTSKSTTSSTRTVSCGPSYGSRAFFPDPLDIWVATYQKIRLEDEVQEDKITTKRQRLIKRQELKGVRRSCKESNVKPSTIVPSRNHKSPNSILSNIDQVTLDRTLDQLCRQLNSHSLIRQSN